MMKTQDVDAIIARLLDEMEEEDVGISLFTTVYQIDDDLKFFSAADRKRIKGILNRLSDDSHRHKKMLEAIVMALGEARHEN